MVDHEVGKDRQFVTALARGLDVLRCFDRPRIELSVSQIARQTGLTQPTTWRLCNTLIECGFLVRSVVGSGLRIGAPALTLGYAAIKDLEVPAIVLPYLRQLTDRTRGNTTLSLRHDNEMVSIEQCDGEFVLPNQPVGWTASLSSVSSGLAVLAAMPPAERAAAMAQLEARDQLAWPRRRARIEQAQQRFAEDGYVRLEGMLDGQYAAIAAPLIDAEGGRPRYWAISCGGLSARWDEAHLERAAEALVELAALLQPALTARSSIKMQPSIAATEI